MLVIQFSNQVLIFSQCLFPLQPVRGNFPRVMLALNELKSLSRSVLTRRLNARDCILDGIKETLAQFSRMAQVSKQVFKI